MSLGGFCWSQTEKWLDDAAVSVPAAERWGRLTAAQPLASVCATAFHSLPFGLQQPSVYNLIIASIL